MNAGSAADDFGCPRDKTCQEGRRTDPRTLVWLVHPLQRGGPCFSSSWHQSMFRPSCMHDEGHHPVDRLTRDPITSELPTIGHRCRGHADAGEHADKFGRGASTRTIKSLPDVFEWGPVTSPEEALDSGMDTRVGIINHHMRYYTTALPDRS